jgi:hypothetical protein
MEWPRESSILKNIVKKLHIIRSNEELKMQSKTHYVNYEYFYKCRPEENSLKDKPGNIRIRCVFPKTIQKGTYILSAFPAISFDAVKEFYVLYKILKKPFQICATSGKWEGTPFLVYAKDDIIITLEDEKIIQETQLNLEDIYKCKMMY